MCKTAQNGFYCVTEAYMDFDWDNRLICPISCDLKHGFHRVQKTLVYKGKLVVFFGFFDNFKEF